MTLQIPRTTYKNLHNSDIRSATTHASSFAPHISAPSLCHYLDVVSTYLFTLGEVWSYRCWRTRVVAARIIVLCLELIEYLLKYVLAGLLWHEVEFVHHEV